MTGPTTHSRRVADKVTIYFGDARRRGPRAVEKAASIHLTAGEHFAEDDTRQMGDWGGWALRVVPAAILTLAQVRQGTGFPRGTRFLVLPPGDKTGL